MIKWKTIYSHSWNNSEYENLIKILKGKEIPKSEKMKKRSKIYSYDKEKDRLVYEYKGNLPWNMKENVPLISESTKEHVFYVAKPGEIKKIVTEYFNSMAKISVGKHNLYDKIIRDKWLGISRANVGKILKDNDIRRKSLIRFKKPIIKSYRPLYPLQHWQMDLIDMQNVEDEGYKWILVIVDIFSKYTYAVALKNKLNITISKELENIFLTGDIPEYLQSDNDSSLTRNNVMEILSELNIYQIVNPSYSPQTNGIVENKVKLIGRLIKIYFDKNKTQKWKQELPKIIFNINTTKHSVTEFTPLQVHRGIESTRVNLTKEVDDVEYTSDDIEYLKNYMKDKESEVKARNYYVKEKIEKEARKREQKQRTQLLWWNPDIRDLVLIPKYIQNGNKFQEIVLIKNYGSYSKQINPEATYKLKSFVSKKETTFFDIICVIKQKIKDSKNGRYYYILTLQKDNNVILEYKNDTTSVSKKFYPEMLYPYEEYYEKGVVRSKTHTSSLKLSKSQVKSILNKLPKLPSTKVIEPPIYIKMVWKVDSIDKWFKGRILRKNNKKNLIFDISYDGDVWQLDLSEDFYSNQFLKDNWYFLEESRILEKYA